MKQEACFVSSKKYKDYGILGWTPYSLVVPDDPAASIFRITLS
jgi:hypothetical protein